MSFNVPVEVTYDFTFREVLTYEIFKVSEVGTSVRDASLRAYKKLVASDPKKYYTLVSVGYPRQVQSDVIYDARRDQYMKQANASNYVLDSYNMQNAHNRRYT